MNISQRQVLFEKLVVNISWPVLGGVDIIAVAVLVELEDGVDIVDQQVRVLADGYVYEALLLELGDLAIRLVGGDDELDIFAKEDIHGGGNDPLIQKNAPGQKFSGFFQLAFLQIFQPLLLVLLFFLFPFLLGLVFHLQTSPIENKDGLDVVVVQDFDHLEQVVQKFHGCDILGELEVAAVAAAINPRHDIDGDSLVLEGGDMLFLGYGLHQA